MSTAAALENGGDLRDALVAALGAEQVTNGESELDLHAADLHSIVPHRPDVVVYPTSTESRRGCSRSRPSTASP